jgi:signal transduction histidine kinase
MSGQQSREGGLAELGVRSLTVSVDDSLADAAARLDTDAETLRRVVDAARREGQAVDAAAGLCARSESTGVTVFSTRALRADALAWAGVAHELRNTLTTIAGWAQVAAETRDPKRAKQAIEIVQASAREAMDVAPVLLEARAAGESADVPRTLRQVVDRFAPVAAERKVMLACRRLDEGSVDTSRAALTSIVANLVKNAIEACEPGGRVEIGARDAPQGIEIIVEDDGRGMSDEAVRELFGPRPLDKEGPRAGRGIGLSIVRTLVTRSGGTARVTSRVGAGSCVRVQLPRSQGRSASSGVRARSNARRVLVVDDNLALAELIGSALELRGASVLVTSDPAQALEAAAAERFDVALVDLDLGEKSGAALVAQLVATRMARRVIVMSGASAVPDLGADGVLRKPFDLVDVEEIALESTRVGKRRAR